MLAKAVSSQQQQQAFMLMANSQDPELAARAMAVLSARAFGGVDASDAYNTPIIRTAKLPIDK